MAFASCNRLRCNASYCQRAFNTPNSLFCLQTLSVIQKLRGLAMNHFSQTQKNDRKDLVLPILSRTQLVQLLAMRWSRESVCCCMSAVGCFVGPLMLLSTSIGYFSDADPVLAMMAEAKGPGEDFVFVPGGCNITNVTFQLESYCVSGCTGISAGTRLCRYYPEYHGVFVDDPTLSFSEVFEDGVTEDGLSCREDPERPPAHAPQVGDVVPCWRSQLDPVSAVYRCLCRNWFRFCPAHQGICAKFVDPVDLWQAAELDRDLFWGHALFLFWDPPIAGAVMPGN